MALLPSFQGVTVALDGDRVGVDEIRELTDSPVVRYVVNTADALKPACVSALLKVVEEGSAAFVFVCGNVARLSPALLSRCLRQHKEQQKYATPTEVFAAMPAEVAVLVKQGLGQLPSQRLTLYKDKFGGRGFYRGLLLAYANKQLFTDVPRERWSRVEQLLFGEIGYNKYGVWWLLGGKR